MCSATMRNRFREKPMPILRAAVICILVSIPVFSQTYDLVIRGGCVLDPETGLDAVRDVAIAQGKIARISTGPLAATRIIDAHGLVVAPGFIDLHQHGQTEASQRLKA